MDWTFWAGLVGILVLTLLIRWGNAAWRRRARAAEARRTGQAVEAVGTDSDAISEAERQDAERRRHWRGF